MDSLRYLSCNVTRTKYRMVAESLELVVTQRGMTLLLLISHPFQASALKWNHKVPLLPAPHAEILNVASNKFPVSVW